MASPDAEILTAAGDKIAAKSMPSGRKAEVVVLVSPTGTMLGATDSPIPVAGTVLNDSTQETTRNGYLSAIVDGLTDLNGELGGAGVAATDVTLETTGYVNFTSGNEQDFAAEIDTLMTSILARLDALEA